MKILRLTLIGILFFTFNLSMAQLEKGNMLIGGNAGFNTQFSDGGENDFSLFINSNISSLVTDNVAVGGILGLGYFKSGDFASTSLRILPNVRVYFPSTGNMAFFVNVSAGLNLSSITFNITGEQTETAPTYELGPGLAFFISEDLSVDLSLNYIRVGGEFDRSSLNFNIGLQAFLVGDSE